MADYTAPPEFPEGTPQYDRYRAELRTELDAWARGDDPYPYDPPAGTVRVGQTVDGHPVDIRLVHNQEEEAANVALISRIIAGEPTSDDNKSYFPLDSERYRCRQLHHRSLLAEHPDGGWVSTRDGRKYVSKRLTAGDPLPWSPAYVRSACGHSMAASEWRAGFTNCERCPQPKKSGKSNAIGAILADGTPDHPATT